MKGFGIYVKNELLEPKHHEKMGVSLWLYLWLLDKMTSISEAGTGKVLGGKPVRYEDVKTDLGLSRTTYARYICTLRDAGYVSTLRTPYGLVITVHKATKIFNNRDVSKVKHPDVAQSLHQSTENETSVSENETSNKTIQLDNTKTIQQPVALDSPGYLKAKTAAQRIRADHTRQLTLE